MLLRKAFNIFIDHQRLMGNSAHTIKYYENSLMKLIEYLGQNTKVEEVTIERLNEYKLYIQGRVNEGFTSKKKQKLSTVTIASYVRAIRAFFNFLKREGFADLDMEKYPIPRQQKYIIDVLSYQEIEKLLSSFNEKTMFGCRNKAMVSLLLDCGLRRHEVVTLKIRDVKFEQNIITVTGKGNKRRSVPLGISTKKILYKYMYTYRPMEEIETGRVFLSGEGEPITDDTIKMVFYRLKKKLEMPRLTPHLLRHTFATQYLINNGDSITLQLILGHTTQEMVKKYIHVANTEMLFSKKTNSLIDNLYKHRYQ